MGAILLTALIYLRGWRKLNRQVPARFPTWRLGSFLGGLLALFLALASPLDAFGSLLLLAHMAQHLLLTMVVPPLLLLGAPQLPLLSGLPRIVAVAWEGNQASRAVLTDLGMTECDRFQYRGREMLVFEAPAPA